MFTSRAACTNDCFQWNRRAWNRLWISQVLFPPVASQTCICCWLKTQFMSVVMGHIIGSLCTLAVHFCLTFSVLCAVMLFKNSVKHLACHPYYNVIIKCACLYAQKFHSNVFKQFQQHKYVLLTKWQPLLCIRLTSCDVRSAIGTVDHSAVTLSGASWRPARRHADNILQYTAIYYYICQNCEEPCFVAT